MRSRTLYFGSTVFSFGRLSCLVFVIALCLCLSVGDHYGRIFGSTGSVFSLAACGSGTLSASTAPSTIKPSQV